MTGEKRDVVWLSDMDDLEPYCIAMRKKGSILYFYPYVQEIAALGCKCVTRDGRTVSHLQIGYRDGVEAVAGTVDGVEHQWDIAGRHSGPYLDSPLDIFIQERYFDRHWRRKMKLTNAEWQTVYGRPHPSVELPKPKMPKEG